jgi:hypothetical protein
VLIVDDLDEPVVSRQPIFGERRQYCLLLIIGAEERTSMAGTSKFRACEFN